MSARPAGMLNNLVESVGYNYGHRKGIHKGFTFSEEGTNNKNSNHGNSGVEYMKISCQYIIVKHHLEYIYAILYRFPTEGSG